MFLRNLHLLRHLFTSGTFLLMATCVAAAAEPSLQDAVPEKPSKLVGTSCVELPTNIRSLNLVFACTSKDRVEVRWVAENVKGVSAEFLISTSEYDVKPPLNKFTLTRPTKGWPEGLYRVEIVHERKIIHLQRYLLVAEEN